MFNIGAPEILVIAIVAILAIGPKDLPLAMRTAGRWIGQMRRVSNHFRAGIDAMVREAEIEEMEKKWKERNAQIMRDHPDEMTTLPPPSKEGDISQEHDPAKDDPAPTDGASPGASASASAEARVSGQGSPPDTDTDVEVESTANEPQLPLHDQQAAKDRKA